MLVQGVGDSVWGFHEVGHLSNKTTTTHYVMNYCAYNKWQNIHFKSNTEKHFKPQSSAKSIKIIYYIPDSKCLFS